MGDWNRDQKVSGEFCLFGLIASRCNKSFGSSARLLSSLLLAGEASATCCGVECGWRQHLASFDIYQLSEEFRLKCYFHQTKENGGDIDKLKIKT